MQPAASGTVVPLNCLPMYAPTSAPLNVEMNPCSDAAIQAIEPIGSMAMAPKFDTAKLKQAMVID